MSFVFTKSVGEFLSKNQHKEEQKLVIQQEDSKPGPEPAPEPELEALVVASPPTEVWDDGWEEFVLPTPVFYGPDPKPDGWVEPEEEEAVFYGPDPKPDAWVEPEEEAKTLIPVSTSEPESEQDSLPPAGIATSEEDQEKAEDACAVVVQPESQLEEEEKEPQVGTEQLTMDEAEELFDLVAATAGVSLVPESENTSEEKPKKTETDAVYDALMDYLSR